MACVDNSDPVYGPDILTATSAPGVVNIEIVTKALFDTYPQQYKDAGFSCAQAKAFVKFAVDYVPSPFAVVDDGEELPIFSEAFVTGSPTWAIAVFVDGVSQGNIICEGGVIIQDNTPYPLKAASTFASVVFQVVFSEDPIVVQYPIQTKATFNFQKWWVCAGGCVPLPPRLGMHILSNHTFAVNNSLGKMPR